MANVKLNIDHFVIELDSGKEIVSCKEFCIMSESLSCFMAQKNFITFRFSTENLRQYLGSSRCEIITNRQTYKMNHNEVFVNTNLVYNISCRNCTQLLCQKVSFKRVLPLPENPDSSDWFCHAHDNNNQSLAPKINEAFYSHCFVHVNENLLSGHVKTSSGLICKRCLAWIGIVLKRTHKIWFSTVTFSSEYGSFTSCPLNDVFKTVQQILNSSLLTSCRMVLKCYSSETQLDFILLWVLEKKLSVCFNLSGDEECNNVAKVLFKFENGRSDLISQWLTDINVSVVEISKPMMVKLLRHLYDMNRYIPKDFSISNNFYVSYLMMYKENDIK